MSKSKEPTRKEVTLTNKEISRYSRHLTLPEIGKSGQILLKEASVLCIGTGGLGSPLLMYLTAAGIGTIGIVDHDIVDESNLQRQIIHKTSKIGESKTSSAQEALKDINPYCNIKTYNEMLTSENALELIGKYDIICDGTDNFPTRYLVNDACVILKKPLVYGSIFRFEGQASVFNLSKDSPNYRDLVSEPPPPGLVPSCAEGGVMGVVPGLIGLIQATEVIKIVTKIGKPLDGRLLIFDSLKMTFKELTLRKNPNLKKIEKLIDYKEFCGLSKNSSIEEEAGAVEIITVQQLNKGMTENTHEYCIIDVRNKEECDIAKIKGAVHIPLEKIENPEALVKITKLMMDKQLVVHCKLGGRSAKALIALKRHGIEGKNLEGGINEWAIQIDKTMAQY